jgi:hypothetical protein
VDVVHLTPPGRFPTVIHDPGLWWDALQSDKAHTLGCSSVNYHWWRWVCSRAVVPALLTPLARLDRWHRRLSWRAEGKDVPAMARAAGHTLSALQSHRTYECRAGYFEALAPFARFLETLNSIQSEIWLSVEAGPRVRNLDYDDSHALVRYARMDSFLRRSIAAALPVLPRTPGLVTLSVTSPEDLLTVIITCLLLRERFPASHLCLIDHGYENFSLHPYINSLRVSGVFEEVFHSIVVSKDERDDVVPALVTALAEGAAIPRYLARESLPCRGVAPLPGRSAPPLTPTFCAEPILWTRLSKRRCYWNRCTYCTQNSKYADQSGPTRSEILRSLDRLQSFVASGCSHFIFSDEAVSPATLRLLAQEIEARKLRFHWACRCKIERAHNASLFNAVGRVGCYEILYGLETTSPRILKLMDKYVDGLNEARLGQVFREMEAAGIGVHVSLIGGYPGDTADETRESVNFLAHEFATLKGGTYTLNSFALLPDTPTARTPQQYGIARVTAPGDVAQTLGFELFPEIALSAAEAAEEIPRLREHLDQRLGWCAIGPQPIAPLAQSLYFRSGHGSLFKASKHNPFANPLQADG